MTQDMITAMALFAIGFGLGGSLGLAAAGALILVRQIRVELTT